MDCEQFRMLLDAYIDNELPEEEKNVFLTHAQDCECCREELRSAEMLRDVLSGMDDDIVVPLEAQADWRMAVRAEAKRKVNKKRMRIGTAIAAVFILVFGCTLMFRSDLFNRQSDIAENDAAAKLMIASDGMSETSDFEQAEGDVYSAWRKIETDRYDAACKVIEDLVSEYSGSCTAETGADGAKQCMYRIEIPYEYMPDFLNAAGRLGTELDSETVESEEEIAVIYIELVETA